MTAAKPHHDANLHIVRVSPCALYSAWLLEALPLTKLTRHGVLYRSSQGSGIAIYFPKTVDDVSKDYKTLVNFDSPALADWKGFLDMLYTQTSKYTDQQGVAYEQCCHWLCSHHCGLGIEELWNQQPCGA
jgi:hypothetical protein